MCEGSENTFEEIPFLYPEKTIVVVILPSYCSLLHTYYLCFPSGLLTFPVLVFLREPASLRGVSVNTNSGAHVDLVHWVLCWQTPESLFL